MKAWQQSAPQSFSFWLILLLCQSKFTEVKLHVMRRKVRLPTAADTLWLGLGKYVCLWGWGPGGHLVVKRCDFALQLEANVLFAPPLSLNGSDHWC